MKSNIETEINNLIDKMNLNELLNAYDFTTNTIRNFKVPIMNTSYTKSYAKYFIELFNNLKTQEIAIEMRNKIANKVVHVNEPPTCDSENRTGFL